MSIMTKKIELVIYFPGIQTGKQYTNKPAPKTKQVIGLELCLRQQSACPVCIGP